MSYNGFWYNKDERIMVYKVYEEEGEVKFHNVDEKGNIINKSKKVNSKYIETLLENYHREL